MFVASRTARSTVALVALGCALLSASCRTAASLSVELVSDYAVGVEVASTRVTATPTDVTAEPRAETRMLDPRAPLTTEQTVAELADVRAATYDVLVELLDASDATVASRHVTVRVRGGANDVHVSLTRSCESVSCPGAGDDPDATECVGGRCVAPTCTDPSCSGGGGGCVTNDECPAPVADCAIAVCREGLCLQASVAGACADGEVCVPDLGCEPTTTGCEPASLACCDATNPCCDLSDPSCASCAPGDPSCCDPDTDPSCCDPAVESCCAPDDPDCDGATGADDCMPDDDTIAAGGEELCGDGTDQNCNGEDLACDPADEVCTDLDGDGCCAEDDDLDDTNPDLCDPDSSSDVDTDEDGYTDADEMDACSDPTAPINPLINPDGVEICGDGIDEDCDGEDSPRDMCAGRYGLPCGAHGACLDSPHEHLACLRPRGSRTRSCLHCCVVCANQSRFHWVNVDHDCARAAARYCSRHGRGGVSTAPGVDAVQWGICRR